MPIKNLSLPENTAVGEYLSRLNTPERVIIGATLGALLTAGYNKYEKDNRLLTEKEIEERDINRLLVNTLGGAGIGVLSNIVI